MKPATNLLNGAPYTGADKSSEPNYLRERFKAIREAQEAHKAAKKKEADAGKRRGNEQHRVLL